MSVRAPERRLFCSCVLLSNGSFSLKMPFQVGEQSYAPASPPPPSPPAFYQYYNYWY